MLSPTARETAVSKFCELVRFRTVSSEGPVNGAYNACADWLLNELKLIGFDAHLLAESMDNKPIVVGTWKGTSPELPVLLLNSHYDVVPVVEENWTVPAFDGLRKDERIYGRGTQDMKCVCIQYLAALKSLQEINFKPVRTIVVTYVPDEEIGGMDGMNVLLRSEWFATLQVGLALDEGLANEESDYSVFYGERIPWWVMVTAKGNTGHASRFVDGTAVEQLLGVANRAMKYRQEQYDLLHGASNNGGHAGCSHSVAAKNKNKKTIGDVTSLNITSLKAGVYSETNQVVINVVPPEAELIMDIRVSPNTPTTEIVETLDSWCREVTAHSKNLPSGGGVSWRFQHEPLKTHNLTSVDPLQNIWWRVFKDTLLMHCGIKCVPGLFPAATDSRFLRAMGVRAFGFSPMRRTPILLHENDEYLEENVFIEGCEVYARLLFSLASHEAMPGEIGYVEKEIDESPLFHEDSTGTTASLSEVSVSVEESDSDSEDDPEGCPFAAAARKASRSTAKDTTEGCPFAAAAKRASASAENSSKCPDVASTSEPEKSEPSKSKCPYHSSS